MNYQFQKSHGALTALTLALCLCAPVSAYAKPKADKSTTEIESASRPDQPESNRFLEKIDALDREITIDKAHRTAIVTQMDEVRQQLQKLKSEEGRENEKKPSLDHGIATINQTIAALESQLEEKIVNLASRKQAAENQPVPTLLEDALGGEAAIEKHRALALKKYQLYRAKIEVQRSREKKKQLRARKVALTETSMTLQNTLGGYQTDVQDLIESRKTLELQFTELSAAIVQKQDQQEKLVKRLQEVKSSPQQAMFSSHRGDLLDPTAGVLQHRYAEPKAQGLLKWEGILIAAPLGQQIEAVFDGTVVFADHMQGFGDVAILDHGEGYMSLYGMADFLVVEEGQQVLSGDIIGTVGGSIGNDESTLYFEIRHNANTLDPEDWLGMSRISQDNEP